MPIDREVGLRRPFFMVVCALSGNLILSWFVSRRDGNVCRKNAMPQKGLRPFCRGIGPFVRNYSEIDYG